jgi:biotin carboxyl carrier protein
MRFEAEIDGSPLTLELDQVNGRISARVGDRSYQCEVLRPASGVYLIMVGDEVYEARVWQAGPDSLRVQLKDRAFSAKIIDRKHRRPAAESFAEGRQQLIAPMAGKVVRVLLGPGDEVAAGQGVVVVEAMKMQNEIKSPKSGRVVEVRVSAGATVNANQVLAAVE